MRDRFAQDAKEVFEEADVDPSTNPELFEQAINTLSGTMARLSVVHGMTWTRVRLYSEQKTTLVQDLIELKAAGKLK